MSLTKHYILEAANRSTIHGLPQFASVQRPYLLRVFWLISLVVSSAICGFIMFASLSKYFEYNVITTVQKIGETPAPFPKVTICNSNFVMNQATYNYASRVVEENPELKEDMFDDYESMEQFVALQVATKLNSSVKEKKFGNSLSEMIISCEFESVKCDLNQAFSFTEDSLNGYCYNFNGGLDMNSTKTRIISSSLVGKKYGLRLKLYVPHLNWFDTFSSIYGVKVAIHNQSFSISAPKFNAFDVAVDTETSVSVKREFSIRLPTPYNQCVQDLDNYDSVFLKLFKDAGTYYIRQFCFRLCLRLVEVCGCHDPAFIFYGRYTLGRRACTTYEDFKCLNKNFENFFRYEVNANCSKDCPLECESSEYSISATTASFPKDNYYYVMLSQSEYLARTVLNMSNLEVARLIKNLEFDKLPSHDVIESALKGKTLSLNVYYEELGYTMIQESPEIYLIDLIASKAGLNLILPKVTCLNLFEDLGGLLGLWIGASFMSFLEIIDLAVLLVVGVFTSTHQKGLNIGMCV